MDVKINGIISKINEYIQWLEIALRAQVICNVAFTDTLEQIEKFVLSGADGYVFTLEPDDSMRKRFGRLQDLITAVYDKYNVNTITKLRHLFGSENSPSS